MSDHEHDVNRLAQTLSELSQLVGADTLEGRALRARRTIEEQRRVEEQIAEEVRQTAETQREMAEEYEQERVDSMVTELRALGWTVEEPK